MKHLGSSLTRLESKKILGASFTRKGKDGKVQACHNGGPSGNNYCIQCKDNYGNYGSWVNDSCGNTCDNAEYAAVVIGFYCCIVGDYRC